MPPFLVKLGVGFTIPTSSEAVLISIPLGADDAPMIYPLHLVVNPF